MAKSTCSTKVTVENVAVISVYIYIYIYIYIYNNNENSIYQVNYSFINLIYVLSDQ